MELSQLLDPSRVALNIRAAQRDVVIKEVAGRLEGAAPISDFQGLLSEILLREGKGSTWIGNDVALPHARTNRTSELIMAAGRCVEGFAYDGAERTVRLIFVLATPKPLVREYLSVVSMLCRVLKDPATRSALLEAPTAEAFVSAIAEAETRIMGAA